MANHDDDDEGSLYTSIGIGIAIGGNVLISLALNIQKFAHKQLHDAKRANASNGSTRPSTPNNQVTDESRPLLPRTNSASSASAAVQIYGTSAPKSKRFPRITIFQKTTTAPDNSFLSPQAANGDLDDDDELHEANGTESDYLRSKLWWLGFLLMNVGEIGNFLSYAYAPASLVAPLGTVALVANCFFAPLMLHERFRKRDFFGIILAIVGSVTVVLSSKPIDVRLDKDGLIEAICQAIFIGYTIVTVVAIVFLTLLSRGNAGRDYIFVDVGICALFGGYTVLATKALSTLISLEFIQIYKLWITYPLVAVLLGTGVGQIRYLNRALMKFDSKHVIPTQFVMFNLTAIIGSAILYRDFEDITLHKMISFVYGILTVFIAIFILTYSPSPPVSSTGTPLLPLDDPIAVLTSPVTPTTAADTIPSSETGTAINIVGASGNKHVLRTKASTAKLGLSPGQYLLLAASPPSSSEGGVSRPRGGGAERDVERNDFNSVRARRGRSFAPPESERSHSVEDGGRRRTIHFDDPAGR